jgi:hypothetical protein
MALVTLKRFEDGLVLADFCVEFSGFRWVYVKPVHRTITGVSIPQKISVRERWWDAAFEFASDNEGVGTLAHYDTLARDANDDKFFVFTDIDGVEYKCRAMLVIEPTRLQEIPDETVLRVPITFKEDGHYP